MSHTNILMAENMYLTLGWDPSSTRHGYCHGGLLYTIDIEIWECGDMVAQL